MSASADVLDETSAQGGWFKTTHWSVVLDAGHNDPARRGAALAKLCQAYWPPLHTYIRCRGHSPEDAKDLTQEFFARLLEKDYLKAVQPGTAKFRSFLLVALKRFLANEWDHANRLKRGGGREIVSLDEADAERRYAAELVDERTPEKAFEHRWAMTLLEQVLDRLEAELTTGGKEELFAELKDFLTGDRNGNSYDEIARRLRMTEGTLRVNIHRLRQRYRQLLRLEIAQTVGRPEEIDEEIRHLFAALSG